MGNGKNSVEETLKLQPDVVVMDISMKVMSGLEAARRLWRQAPKTKVIILVDRDTQESVTGTFLAGARGCILKTTASTDLAFAIRAVQAGQWYLHPSLTKTLVEAYLLLRKAEVRQDPYEQLSEREKHVLRLVAEGRTSRQIAGELGIAVKTVTGHRATAMSKLGIHNRAELIKYAIRRGIVDLEAS